MTDSKADDVARWSEYCAELLETLQRFVSELDDTVFAGRPRGASRAGVGTHVRHILDAYESLVVRGAEVGTIDYDQRERRPEVEQDRNVALRAMGSLIEQLRKQTAEGGDRPLRVRCDEPGHGTVAAASSLARELRFVASHAVHHQALIAELMREQGQPLPVTFGVARSTLKHRGEAS